MPRNKKENKRGRGKTAKRKGRKRSSAWSTTMNDTNRYSNTEATPTTTRGGQGSTPSGLIASVAPNYRRRLDVRRPCWPHDNGLHVFAGLEDGLAHV